MFLFSDLIYQHFWGVTCDLALPQKTPRWPPIKLLAHFQSTLHCNAKVKLLKEKIWASYYSPSSYNPWKAFQGSLGKVHIHRGCPALPAPSHPGLPVSSFSRMFKGLGHLGCTLPRNSANLLTAWESELSPACSVTLWLPPKWNFWALLPFTSQIWSIPLLWEKLPYSREVSPISYWNFQRCFNMHIYIKCDFPNNLRSRARVSAYTNILTGLTIFVFT